MFSHHLHTDNVGLANKKNTLGKSRLETDLNRINREHVIEMRMHNNAKQRFKNKYSKLDVFDESKGSEGSDVVMYETHNPGFCYRRNGDCRLPQSNVKSSSLDMEDLHMLLFTNDEIDIDKVLCLYLLTAHKTETLYPPSKAERTSFLAREQSPLERLVDRSKKRQLSDSKLIKGLPLYILEARPYGRKDPIRDARLLSKIIINDKILQIVASVKNALQVSNPDIVVRFMQTISNMDELKLIMRKPKMLNFYKNLNGQNIISSCESFHLETPQRINLVLFDINVRPLDDLVRLIRKNILLKPNANSWRIAYKSPLNKSNDKSLISLSNNITNSDSETIITSNGDEDDDDDDEGIVYATNLNDLNTSMMLSESSYVRLDKHNAHADDDIEFVLDYNEEDHVSIDNTPRAPMFQSKIMKNMQMGFSNIEFENDLPTPSSLTFAEQLELDKLANLLSKKARKETRKDYRKMMNEQRNSDNKTNKIESTEFGSSTSQQANCKVLLRQTICGACLRKWQKPLPVPKLSKLKKIPLPTLTETSYFSSKSAQRISDLIDEEVKKFEYTDSLTKDNSNKKFSDKLCQELAKGNYVTDSIEIIDLDELELAKIRQEIKENETRKKLKEFLQKENI